MKNLFIKLLAIPSRFLLIIISIIISIGLGGYFAFLAYQTIFYIPNVTVPSVVNMELSAAQQRLYKTGLKMKIVNEKNFSHNETFYVVSQRPSVGDEVKKNRTVEVEIETKMNIDRIPDLVGKTIEEAEEIVVKSGFKVGDIAYSMHYELPKGVVIAQSPSPGENLSNQNNERINILVSKGLY